MSNNSSDSDDEMVAWARPQTDLLSGYMALDNLDIPQHQQVPKNVRGSFAPNLPQQVLLLRIEA